MKQFISDFQAFISRGNVVDMAVGVIVGAAFTAIVNSAVFHFLLMALVVFCLVRVVNKVRTAAEAKLMAKKKEEEQAAKAAPAPIPADIVLLQEIRDLLKQQSEK